MPVVSFLANHFDDSIDEALDLVRRAEASSTFTYTSRLYIYEAAYLLVFAAWENFLEESFLRLMCGYKTHAGSLIPLKPGKTRPVTATAARAALFGTRDFLLWHSPNYSKDRALLWFVGGPHETVVNSVFTELEDYASIRHYVAHRNQDSRTKFDASCRRLSGAGVLGNRAGRFLRLETATMADGSDGSWLSRIAEDLAAYARQICA